jgi:hypothetical protein
VIKIGPERLEGDWSPVDEICKFKDGLDDPEQKFNTMDEFFFE